jgi:uncharacterized protein (DUF885 family)
MHRRQFLLAATASAAVTTTDAVAAPARQAVVGAAQGDAALARTFDAMFQRDVRRSPAYASALGLDKGANADLKSRFDLRPNGVARAQNAAERRRDIARLQGYNPARLSDAQRLNREIVLWDLNISNVGPTRFDVDNVQTPYVLTQQNGAYFDIPDFLNTTHTIDSRADAEAYLARLAQLAVLLDNDSREQQAQAARGVVAPGWSLDLALGQLAELRAPAAAANGLTQSLVTRAAAKGIGGDWARRASAIVAAQVYPAVDRQIALLKRLRATTPAGDGAWRLPNGDALYAAALAEATTTSFTPDEVHRLGLQQVAEITAQLDVILKTAGFSNGSVGERLAALNRSPDQLYANTDAGRAELIASLNRGVAAMQAKLPQAFATVPRQPLEIRRVPPEIQEGASNGYYRSATIDGSRPAIYFINLKSTGDWPRYSLPALTYHEGVPGHHLQGSIAQLSQDLPMLRRNQFYSAYGEGWALYAEQLADELGGYQGLERAGYLQSYLFRASRLVVDTGLHSKRWTREQAVDYMTATTGFARARVKREVERYCVLIGQACSYKIGHLAWVRARAEAQRALGAKFDLKQFHEVLKDGAMPLTILERRIRERTAAQLRA